MAPRLLRLHSPPHHRNPGLGMSITAPSFTWGLGLKFRSLSLDGKTTKDLPSPGRMPSNPFRQKPQLHFLLCNRHRENFTLYTYKENLFYGGNIRKRAAETNSGRAQVPCAPSRCSGALELPQLQFAPVFAENWSRTSGLELRSSLESGTVLLAVAPYHSSAAATWSVDNKRKSCLDLPFYTSVSKWHL